MPAIAAAAASVVNNTVTNLFQSGVTNAKKALTNAQKELVIEQGRLDQLLNAQNYSLNQEQIQGNLANNQEKNALNSIDAVDVGGGHDLATIYSAGISSSGGSTVLIVCIIGGILVLGGGIYFLTKKN
jgi:hypothetical protein